MRSLAVTALAILVSGCGITGGGSGQIAFTSERTGDWQVFVMGADGTGTRQLTYDDNYHWGPSWSPDGHQIAFSGDWSGNREILVMDSDGRGVIRL
ncbi:MAG: hypothetical protein QGH55_07725, partial [Acidimicrobiales bacterium]|nr:hypothetical protein [Acidimicrobiales bacterium]